ncbi:MAG: ASKHA domain-containing protein [Desulfobacteraceae bacterium]|nr:ASKHA domain-containing protein [Desulfobacteraceae bacterium]
MKKNAKGRKKKKKKPNQVPPSPKGRKILWLNVLPEDMWIKVKRGATVYEALQSRGLDVGGECGGVGTCGKCKVRIITAVAPPGEEELELLTAEEREQGIRLACRVRITKTIVVHTDIAPGQMELFQILKDGHVPHPPADPLIAKHAVRVTPPSLQHPESDFYRLRAALGPRFKALHVSHHCLSELYSNLRRADFEGEAIIHRRYLVDFQPPNSPSGRYGIVFDIGTTTLVGKLIDLADGSEVSVISRLNSQARFGSNVISRIQYVRQKSQGRKRMRELLLRDLNLIARRLLEANRLNPEHVFVAVAAGNTTMQHFLLNLDPSGIAEAPFSPVITEGVTYPAPSVGLELHPNAALYVMPAKSGYIGGDHISFILASGAFHESDGLILGLDFGTNGEMFLGNRRRMLTCSTAAGPALEGARISRGMIARAGAVEGVHVGDTGLQYDVIGNVKPKGLCGSGLVDMVAVLLHYGVVDGSGLLGPEGIRESKELFLSRVVAQADGAVHDFLVAGTEESFYGDRILLTQKDVRELQLAKAAVAAGVQLLLQEMGAGIEDVDRILLAGALGNYVNPYSAMRIGLIPMFDPSRIESVGNAASSGAQMALVNRRHWHEAAEIVDHVEHVELSVHPDFYDRFVREMDFPETNLW